jgi:hypothetical protein
MLTDLTLRLDALVRAHRSLEIASRFPHHPPALQHPPPHRPITRSTLARATDVPDAYAPPPGVAAFEVFLRGRF